MKKFPRRFRHVISEWLTRRSKKHLSAIGILLTVIIGVLDYWTGFEFRMEMLYLIPITYMTWFVNKKTAIFVSMLSLVSIWSTDFLSGRTFDRIVVEAWNMGMFFLFFLIVVSILSKLKNIMNQRASLIDTLQGTIEEVNELSGILPICANCKKIRDDEGYWHDVAAYISKHSKAEFTHGLCKECATTLYPELFKKEKNSRG